jgi:hypothetical protein
LNNSGEALSRKQKTHRIPQTVTEQFDNLAKEYVDGVTSQTRGSHRTKRANEHGIRLVMYLKMIVGTAGEESIAGYLERAQMRLNLVSRCQRKESSQDDHVSMALLLFERLALESVLELDKMEALNAIGRVRRCPRCKLWLWCAVKNQRYCSEKCRVSHYHTSVEGKRYKREWARKAYKRNKALDEEAKRIAASSVQRVAKFSK